MESADVRTEYMAKTLLELYKQWVEAGRPVRK